MIYDRGQLNHDIYNIDLNVCGHSLLRERGNEKFWAMKLDNVKGDRCK